MRALIIVRCRGFGVEVFIENCKPFFRYVSLPVEHGLQERIFAQVLGILQARGLILKKDTIVDSTIIAAPPSTKNREKKRDRDAC